MMRSPDAVCNKPVSYSPSGFPVQTCGAKIELCIGERTVALRCVAGHPLEQRAVVQERVEWYQ